MLNLPNSLLARIIATKSLLLLASVALSEGDLSDVGDGTDEEDSCSGLSCFMDQEIEDRLGVDETTTEAWSDSPSMSETDQPVPPPSGTEFVKPAVECGLTSLGYKPGVFQEIPIWNGFDYDMEEVFLRCGTI